LLKTHHEIRDGEDATIDESDLKEALRKEFFPQHIQKAKQTEFNNWKQGD